MDISVNGGRPAPSTHSAPQANGNKKRKRSVKTLSILGIVLLVLSALLVVSLILGVAFFKEKSENSYVKEDLLQAVFLNGGQVYFGDIETLNEEYIRMSGIYYLRVNQQVQPGQNNQNAEQDISLVKLGCELHGPEDQMVINREQVIFWENLKSDGQVARAVAQYREQNPGEQKCETQTSNTNTQNQNNTPAPATNNNQ